MRHSPAHALVGVEQQPIRPIADRVHHDMQTRLVGAGDPCIQIFRRVDQQAAILRRVVEGFVKSGRVRAQRAVDESLERADAQPFIAPTVGAAVCARARLAETPPIRQRHGGVDASCQGVRAGCAREHVEVAPRAHVVNGGDAVLVHVLHCGGERTICQLGGRRRDDGVDETHGVVLQHARGLAVRRCGRSLRPRPPSVARVTPAARSAALFASAMWPSSRLIHTG